MSSALTTSRRGRARSLHRVHTLARSSRDAGFAIIQLSGNRFSLNELESWRSDNERRVQHELAMGDVNSDGHTDMVSLDAGEQMLEIFTFTHDGSMLYVVLPIHN